MYCGFAAKQNGHIYVGDQQGTAAAAPPHIAVHLPIVHARDYREWANV